jgi:hypothetical protein
VYRHPGALREAGIPFLFTFCCCIPFDIYERIAPPSSAPPIQPSVWGRGVRRARNLLSLSRCSLSRLSLAPQELYTNQASPLPSHSAAASIIHTAERKDLRSSSTRGEKRSYSKCWVVKCVRDLSRSPSFKKGSRPKRLKGRGHEVF